MAQIGSGRDEKTGVFDTHPCDADRIRAGAGRALLVYSSLQTKRTHRRAMEPSRAFQK
jgi:hypothetical protein